MCVVKSVTLSQEPGNGYYNYSVLQAIRGVLIGKWPSQSRVFLEHWTSDHFCCNDCSDTHCGYHSGLFSGSTAFFILISYFLSTDFVYIYSSPHVDEPCTVLPIQPESVCVPFQRRNSTFLFPLSLPLSVGMAHAHTREGERGTDSKDILRDSERSRA